MSQQFPSKELNLEVIINSTRDGDGTLLTASPQFFSHPSKDIVKHLLELQVPIPMVNCNRKGDGCPTYITELQNHNDHVPVFQDEKELNSYIARIMVHTEQACRKVGVWLTQLQKQQMQAITFALSTKLMVCGECGEVKEDDARVQAGMKCGACAYGNDGDTYERPEDIEEINYKGENE